MLHDFCMLSEIAALIAVATNTYEPRAGEEDAGNIVPQTCVGFGVLAVLVPFRTAQICAR